MIEVGILKNFDSETYKAGVQLAGSLTTYFDDISVAKNIPSGAMVIGNYVIVAIPGGNPRDACVIATWPGGSAGGGMEVHGNEYHDPAFAEATVVYEKITSPVTYEIGSGRDYATIAAACADLRSLILEADITLKLMENITDSTQVVIIGQIAMGGYLRIELNGKTWTLNANVANMVYIGGSAAVVIQTDAVVGGTISVSHPNPTNHDVFMIRNSAFFRLSWYPEIITIDLNNQALRRGIALWDSSVLWVQGCTFQNYGNVTNIFRAVGVARVATVVTIPSPWNLAAGGMFFDTDGTLHTAKGEVAYVP